MPGNIFNFFGLPRELRDDVYDRLHEEVTIAEEDQPKYQIRTPIAKLRLINKQFTAEYDDRSPEHCELHAMDLLGWQWEDLDLPRRATNTTLLNMELCLFNGTSCKCDGSSPASVCDVTKEITEHLEWINKLIHQLPQLRTANMTIKVASPWCLRVLWRRYHEFVHVAMLSKTEIFCFKDKKIDQDSPRLLLATWSRGQKLDIREAAVEKCRNGEFPRMANV